MKKKRTAPLGEYIKKAREVHGISVEELAQMTGISSKTLHGVEAGYRICGVSALHKIAIALNADIIKILKLTGYIATERTEISFGQVLREARIIANLNQEEATKFCKISYQTYRSSETQKYNPSYKTLQSMWNTFSAQLELLNLTKKEFFSLAEFEEE